MPTFTITLSEPRTDTDYRTPRLLGTGAYHELMTSDDYSDLSSFRRKLRPLTRALSTALTDAGIEHRSLSWGFKAGCSCGCSAGWKINGSFLRDGTVITPTVEVDLDEVVVPESPVGAF